MQKTFLELLKSSTVFFETLQEENRQKIIALLFENGAMGVSEITDNIDLSRPAVSHHLKILLQAHLVFVEKRGRERIYHFNMECLRENIIGFMHLIEDYKKAAK